MKLKERETESLIIIMLKPKLMTPNWKANVGYAVTINYIIRECRKLELKEFTCRQNWVGKFINWELCKRLKFDHTTKWYMQNQELAIENETHKILKDSVIQKDHLIPTRRPDQVITKNKKLPSYEFAVPVDHWLKDKENEKIDKYSDLAWQQKKLWTWKSW